MRAISTDDPAAAPARRVWFVLRPDSDNPAPGPWGRLPWALRDLIMIILLVAPVVVPILVLGLTPGWLRIALPVGLIAVVVVGRRRVPVPTLAVVLAGTVLGLAAGYTDPPLALPLLVAVYSVGDRHDRRVAVVCSVVTMIILIITVYGVVPLALFDPRAISIVTIIATAAAVGDATRTRREYVIAITERAVRAERTRESEASRRVAEDRLRIARDLHDVVAHQIAVINLHAGVASAALPDRPAHAEQSLQTVRHAARSVLAEIGDLLAMLRTTTAETDAAEQQAVASLAQLDHLVDQFETAGLSVQRTLSGDLTDLPPAVDVVGYRVVQETLTNAHKHGAGAVAVSITRTVDELVIGVANRRGTRGSSTGSGHGLDGIRERVASVRGVVTIDRGDTSHRFEVRVRLPLGPQAMGRS